MLLLLGSSGRYRSHFDLVAQLSVRPHVSIMIRRICLKRYIVNISFKAYKESSYEAKGVGLIDPTRRMRTCWEGTEMNMNFGDFVPVQVVGAPERDAILRTQDG